MSDWHLHYFSIDVAPPRFKGYSVSGNYWNGWECPAFEKEEAERILAWAKQLDEDSIDDSANAYSYDVETDTFKYCDAAGDPYEESKGFDITVNGSVRHVYSIGAYAWIWNIDEEFERALVSIAKNMADLVDAMDDIVDNWRIIESSTEANNLITEKYPFDKDFSEIAAAVNNWRLNYVEAYNERLLG